MQKTSIEWTRGNDGAPGMTANPIRARNRATGKLGHHCVKLSPGCANCYSGAWNGWRGNGLPFTKAGGEQAEMFLDGKVLERLLKHRKPCRVFLCDMTDIFGSWVPDEWLDRIFATMAMCRHLTFQVLTKRPERMQAYLRQVSDERDMQRWANVACELTQSPCAAGIFEELDWPLPNVWLGTSVENQATADERIPHLLQTRAAVRFLSCEPLLGPVDLRRHWYTTHNWHDWLTGATGIGRTTDNLHAHEQTGQKIDWVIVGGESGPKARPMHLDWARSVVRQCKESAVPVFVKQIGADPRFNEADIWAGAADKRYDKKGGDWSLWPADLRIREFPRVPVEATP